MTPLATVSHASHGRARIYVPSHRRDRSYFETVADELCQCPGVEKLEANPLTGSILVHHEAPLAAIGEYAEQRKLFRLSARPQRDHRPSDRRVSSALLEKVEELDKRIVKFTNGDFDLDSVIIAGYLGAAFWQARRKHVLPAALALFGEAVSLMEGVRSKRFPPIEEC